VVFSLLLFFSSLQSQIVLTSERTIDCIRPDAHYEVYVKTPETWQVGTLLEVFVRLTLVEKSIGGREVYYVRNSIVPNYKFLSIRVWQSGGEHCWGSVDYDESVNLTKNGDYWEKRFNVAMNSWLASKLERGEVVNASLAVYFTIDEVGADFIVSGGVIPMSTEVVIFRPFLSTAETFGVIGVGGVFAFCIVVFVFYRLRKISFCRWGYHEWRDYGERVLVRWKELTVLEDRTHPHVSRLKKEDVVFTRRECLRCGLQQKRKFAKNKDGMWEVAGFETVGFTG
jgi:hypothetical protein